MVRWYPLPANSPAGLLGYQATYRKTGTTVLFSRNISLPANELELQDLEMFTEYSVAVAGIYALRIGPNSGEINVTTDEDGEGEILCTPLNFSIIECFPLPTLHCSIQGSLTS